MYVNYCKVMNILLGSVGKMPAWIFHIYFIQQVTISLNCGDGRNVSVSIGGWGVLVTVALI